MLENILWFFAGALAHRALSYAFGISAGKKMALFVYDYAILFANAVHVDLERGVKEKHDALWKAGLTDDELKKVKELDKALLLKWKTKVLAKFIVSNPQITFRTKKYLQNINPHDRLKKLKKSLEEVEGA